MKSEISAVKNDIENSISAVKGEISAVNNELRQEMCLSGENKGRPG
jgi:hypothetical protein